MTGGTLSILIFIITHNYLQHHFTSAAASLTSSSQVVQKEKQKKLTRTVGRLHLRPNLANEVSRDIGFVYILLLFDPKYPD